MADKKISQLTAASTPLAGTEVLPIVQSGATVKVSVSNLTAGRPVDVSTLTASGLIKSTTANAFLIQNSTATGANYMRLVNGEGTFYLATENSAGTTFGAPAYANILYGNSAYPVIIYTNGTEKLRVASGGDVTINTGNLVVGTAAKGIDFSANTHAAGMTSELLDWYEEGTWTPVVSDGTNDATMGAGNGGYYTRIGNCVTFTAQVTVGTIDSVGANAIIKGLPFSTDTSTKSRAGVAVGFGSSLNITQGRVVTGYVEINSSKIELQYWDSATGTTGLDGSEISDGGTIMISGHYYAV